MVWACVKAYMFYLYAPVLALRFIDLKIRTYATDCCDYFYDYRKYKTRRFFRDQAHIVYNRQELFYKFATVQNGDIQYEHVHAKGELLGLLIGYTSRCVRGYTFPPEMLFALTQEFFDTYSPNMKPNYRKLYFDFLVGYYEEYGDNHKLRDISKEYYKQNKF
jgi:hypothetical protein